MARSNQQINSGMYLMIGSVEDEVNDREESKPVIHHICRRCTEEVRRQASPMAPFGYTKRDLPESLYPRCPDCTLSRRSYRVPSRADRSTEFRRFHRTAWLREVLIHNGMALRIQSGSRTDETPTMSKTPPRSTSGSAGSGNWWFGADGR